MRKTLEFIGLLALVTLFWFTWSALYSPNRLPDRVPTHFDAAGNPNAWGSPYGMILLPVVATVLYLLVSVVSRFPESFHYPVRTTPQNIARLQTVTLNMVLWLKVEIVCLFALLQWVWIQAARSGDGHLFPMILPFFIAAVFGTIGWSVVAMFRAAR
ncbi:MAG: DUF1648 domain-containing protein [Terracidiphilus sp.]|jgi:uncharacterized membrane protein